MPSCHTSSQLQGQQSCHFSMGFSMVMMRRDFCAHVQAKSILFDSVIPPLRPFDSIRSLSVHHSECIENKTRPLREFRKNGRRNLTHVAEQGRDPATKTRSLPRIPVVDAVNQAPAKHSVTQVYRRTASQTDAIRNHQPEPDFALTSNNA